jgi:hypothetical protein
VRPRHRPDPLDLPLGGAIADEPEARVALHTRRSLVPAIVERAEGLHPYDIPCVIAMSLTGGNPAYLRWVVEETRPSERRHSLRGITLRTRSEHSRRAIVGSQRHTADNGVTACGHDGPSVQLPVDVRVGDGGRRSEAMLLEAVLDALPSPTVLLAPDGTVALDQLGVARRRLPCSRTSGTASTSAATTSPWPAWCGATRAPRP